MVGHRLAEEPGHAPGAGLVHCPLDELADDLAAAMGRVYGRLAQLADWIVRLAAEDGAIAGHLTLIGDGHNGDLLPGAVHLAQSFRVVDVLARVGVAVGLVDALGHLNGLGWLHQAEDVAAGWGRLHPGLVGLQLLGAEQGGDVAGLQVLD